MPLSELADVRNKLREAYLLVQLRHGTTLSQRILRRVHSTQARRRRMELMMGRKVVCCSAGLGLDQPVIDKAGKRPTSQFPADKLGRADGLSFIPYNYTLSINTIIVSSSWMQFSSYKNGNKIR